MEHLCECGCGQETLRGKNSPHDWNKFIKGHFWKGKKLLDESKAKMSKSHNGKKLSDKTKRKMSEVRKGRVFSDDHRKHLSESLTGRIISVETRAKASIATYAFIRKNGNPFKGKKHTGEAKAKIAIARMKHPPDGYVYCDAWYDKEYIKDMRGRSCETCGMTSMMSIHLFGNNLCAHHANGKEFCTPSDIETLCLSCHMKLHMRLKQKTVGGGKL